MIRAGALRLATIALVALVAVTALPSPKAVADPPCLALERPVAGEVSQRFAPVGRYGGHWGVDFTTSPGEVVRAAGLGTVSFAGTVAGNRTITIDHGGGLKTSYSYLEAQWVSAGRQVVPGDALGTTGAAHGSPGLHFSVRLAGTYVDPLPRLTCRPLKLTPALRLIANPG